LKINIDVNKVIIKEVNELDFIDLEGINGTRDLEKLNYIGDNL